MKVAWRARMVVSSVGMLGAIVSDFVRLEAETEAAETQVAVEYDVFISEGFGEGSEGV